VVKQSDGHVTIQSAPGQGTTVHIYLPKVTPQVAATVRKRSGDANRLRGNETILLAEDEPEIRGFLTSVLRQNGYEVLSAAHGAEALAIAQEHRGPIHLLASDMIMPGMNGRALAKQIREARPTTKVLFISGYTDNELDPATDLNDEVQFLKKPFTPRELMRSIRALLDTAK
jgi:DNA-binding response OmpR family regulator